jgi:uncharacterized protein (TIGR02217 family)
MATFQVLPVTGQEWSVTKAPRFATRVQKGVSGRELRQADQPLPIWDFKISFDLLRDQNDIRASGGPGVGHNDLRALMGFFLSQQGSFQTFLFDDPTDNKVTLQSLGAGDGATTGFRFLRSLGGFDEPTTAVPLYGDFSKPVPLIYINGVLKTFSTDYTFGGLLDDTRIGSGVNFASAPGNGLPITATYSYFFPCRFSDDTAEFENMMFQLWQQKQLKFQSILP